MIPTIDSANRMLLGIIEMTGLSYDESERYLSKHTVFIKGGDELRNSAALQAALLTAINCAKRCFLGGIAVEIPPRIDLRLPWPAKTLNEAVAELLKDVIQPEAITERIVVGCHSDDAWNVLATGWKAVVGFGQQAALIPSLAGNDFALGGVFAGALGVHHAFTRTTAIASTIDWEIDGLSLWTPTVPWQAAGDGPSLNCLPDKIWLLGLGHLGQAFAWTMGLLPYASPQNCLAMLQDIDVVTRANYGTGLLTTLKDVNSTKTRMVEQWLRRRSFATRICDRRFDTRTFCSLGEPTVAFCGFHDAASRRLIGDAGFDLVVEAGLGAQISDFDHALVHMFPNSHFDPKEFWDDDTTVSIRDGLFTKLGGNEICGALELAGKAVSTSFVGAMAASLAWSEILRQYQKGESFYCQSMSMRNLGDAKFMLERHVCPAPEIAKRGYASTRRF